MVSKVEPLNVWRSATISGVLLTCFLGGCQSPTLVEPDTLTVAFENSPTSLDPRFGLDAVSSKISDLIYNGLLRRDRNLKLAPSLATGWEWNGNQEITFSLRHGVTFHDGRSFDAKDVKYSYDFILDPKNQSPKLGGFQSIQEVRVLDSHSVQFILNEPFAPLLDNLTLPIVPKPAKGSSDNHADHPIGTGPFRFVSYQSDEELVLAANPSYFEKRPRIRLLRFRIVPDETVRVLELEKGNVSLLLNPISPELLPRLSQKPNLKVEKEVGTNFSYIGFNLDDPILKNLLVRNAIAHAIDRQGIIHHILKGLAVPATFLFSPKNGFHNSQLPEIGYDPDQSKRLLDGAGFPDPDGDGPEPRFTLVYKTSQSELRRRIAVVIQEQLRQIGIQVDIRSYEWGTFFSDIKNGNFQIYSLTWVGISDPDILYYIFHTKSIPPDGANRGRYRNDTVDQLTENGRREQNAPIRKKIYDEIQEILAKEVPYVSLWYSVNVAVFDGRLKGFKLYPDENLISLKDAYME